MDRRQLLRLSAGAVLASLARAEDVHVERGGTNRGKQAVRVKEIVVASVPL